MFNIGGTELLLILFIAFVVVGPKDMPKIGRALGKGVRMLRSYIEFAMNGEATLAKAQRNVRTDEFADAVAQFIRDHGFKVRQYVGCSGYKIDIAVQKMTRIAQTI